MAIKMSALKQWEQGAQYTIQSLLLSAIGLRVRHLIYAISMQKENETSCLTPPKKSQSIYLYCVHCLMCKKTPPATSSPPKTE